MILIGKSILGFGNAARKRYRIFSENPQYVFKINAQDWLKYTCSGKPAGVCIMRLKKKDIVDVPDDISAVRFS